MDHRFALVALLLLAFARASFGQALPAISYPSPGTGTVIPGVLSSNPVSSQQILPAANGANVRNPLQAVIGAKGFEVVADRFVSTANIARAFGNILKGASLIGAAAYVAENARCRFGSDGWACDWGQPKVEEQGWEGTCFGSKVPALSLTAVFTACKGLARSQSDANSVPNAVSSTTTFHGENVCSGSSGNVSCSGSYWRKMFVVQEPGGQPYSVGPAFTEVVLSAQEKLIQLCAAPSVPMGDGCTTPEPAWQPSSPEKVAEQVAPHVATNPAEALRDVLPVVDPAKGIEADPLSVTGPATVQQPVKTTTVTAPNGQPQTTTEQVTNHITYQGDSFTWSNVTTTTAPDGTVTVKDDRPQEEQKSLCEKHPNIVACKELGEAAATPLEEKSLPVAFAIDGGWGGGGQCPPPVQLSAVGVPYSYSYQPLCDFLSGMRPVVVAVAGLVGALIFSAALRKS